jgi:alpha-L-arabinofuranosidase
LAQVYDYSDMLGFVAWLNVLVRKHDDLGLACLAQSVNVVSLEMTTMRSQTDPSDLAIDDKPKWYLKTNHLPPVSRLAGI